MPKIVNPIGKKYGLLTVESFAGLTPCGHKTYNCICDCGNHAVRTGTSIRRSENSSCGCFSKKGVAHHQWTGVGEISSGFWYDHIVKSANGSKYGDRTRRVKELTLTIQEAWDLFLKQKRKCALSGIELQFPKRSKDKSWTASLDRIDSSKGYTLENVQWVHKDINIMKNKFDNDYFIHVCKQIYNFQMAEIFKQELKDKGFTILNEYDDSTSYKQGIDIFSKITTSGACEIQ